MNEPVCQREFLEALWRTVADKDDTDSTTNWRRLYGIVSTNVGPGRGVRCALLHAQQRYINIDNPGISKTFTDLYQAMGLPKTYYEGLNG